MKAKKLLISIFCSILLITLPIPIALAFNGQFGQQIPPSQQFAGYEYGYGQQFGTQYPGQYSGYSGYNPGYQQYLTGGAFPSGSYYQSDIGQSAPYDYYGSNPFQQSNYDAATQFSSYNPMYSGYGFESLTDRFRTSTYGYGSMFGRPYDIGEAIVVNVADYEPKILRQSLLEQQGAPVFLYLKGTTLGTVASPFIDDPHQEDPLSGIANTLPIRFVRIFPDKQSPYIEGYRYIPPRLGDYTLNNLGYLVVFVRQLRTPKDLPPEKKGGIHFKVGNITAKAEETIFPASNVIDLNFTAQIFYDLARGGFFGLSEQDLVLKIEDQKTFEQKLDKTPNSFMAKRGYIRASSIQQGFASFVVYDKHFTPIFFPVGAFPGGEFQQRAAVRVSEGQISQPIRLGFSPNPLEDTIRIRVNTILTPQDRAIAEFEVGGKRYRRTLLRNKQIYTRSSWKVADVKRENLGEKEKAELVSKFGFSSFLLEALPNVPHTLYKHTLKIQSDIFGEKKTITSYTLEPGLGFKLTPPTEQQVGFLERKYCPNLIPEAATEFFTGAEITINESKDIACIAAEKFKELQGKFPGSEDIGKSYLGLRDIYSNFLIDWKDCDILKNKGIRNEKGCERFKADMFKLALFYSDKVKSDFPELIEDLEKRILSSQGFDYLEDEFTSIRLLRVEEVTEKERGKVFFRVGPEGPEQELGGINTTIKPQEHLRLSPGFKFSYEGEPFDWIITSVTPTSVTLRQRKKDRTFIGSKTLTLHQPNQLLVKKEKAAPGQLTAPAPQYSNTIEITRIEVANEAHITVIPGTGAAASTSQFTIHIPIEKRPFEFTPDFMRSQINSTRDMIKDLDNIIDDLDEIVRTWKKVCILTFTALTLKNMIGGGTRAVARRSVAAFYKQKCLDEIQQKKYTTIDECLAKQTDSISKDTDIYESAVEKVNNKLKGKTPEQLKKEDNKLVAFLAAGGQLNDYRDYLLSKELQEKYSSGTPQYIYLTQQAAQIGFEEKIKRYKQAESEFNNLDEKTRANLTTLYGSEQKAILAYLNNIDNIRASLTKTSATASVLPTVPGTNLGLALLPNDKGKIQAVNSVHITEYAYQVYKNGGKPELLFNKVKTKLKKETKSDPSDKDVRQRIAYEYGGRLAYENGLPVYVPKNFYQTHSDENLPQSNPKQIQGQAQLLRFNNNFITEKNIPKNFRLIFSNTIKRSDNRITSTSYSPQMANNLLAQFSKRDGYITCVPTGSNGEYILILDRFRGTGAVKTFRVLNVGANRNMECTGTGDDVIVWDESALFVNPSVRAKYQSILRNFKNRCTENEIAGRINVGLRTMPVRCDSTAFAAAESLTQPKCIDVMEPGDCKLLFNACDPVMCPTSRCNLGGRYYVDNVIQTGLIGSTVLCMPNAKQGVLVPVCLTGILAGLKNIRSIMEGYAECLEINLNQGKHVGICDYLSSVGYCEIFWREIISIFRIKGGFLDFLSKNLFGAPQGGIEYLSFTESLNNAEESFNFFTTEYSQSFLGAFRGKTTEEIGSQICQLQVYGKLPTFGEILDKLAEPEDPPQFTAMFDSVPYAEQAGATPSIPGAPYFYGTQELSLYKVFYHIYAGTGFAEEAGPFTELGIGTELATNPNRWRRVSYSVYLRGPGLPPLYVTEPGRTYTVYKVIDFGDYAQETVQKVAPKGYNEICVNINGRQECGFGKVSSAFSINWLNDRLVASDAEKEITSAEDCVPESPTTGTALGGLATPEQYGLLSTGVIRVCNPLPPTAEIGRWASVGTCGDRGTCWLDRNSVKIKDAQLYNNVLTKSILTERNLKLQKVIDAKTSSGALISLNKARNRIMEKIEALVTKAKRELSEDVKKIIFEYTKIPEKEAPVTPGGEEVTILTKVKCTKTEPDYIKLEYPKEPRNKLDRKHPDYVSNAGLIWIPQQARCGGKFPLIIALHGFRSLKYRGANIFLGNKSHKGFDQITKKFINEGVSEPVIIAAPMDDKLHNDQKYGSKPYWQSKNYNINTHISSIKNLLDDYNIFIDENKISVIGHSNALCGGGVKRAAKDKSLYFIGLADGTCDNLNYAEEIIKTSKNKNPAVMHMDFPQSKYKGDVKSSNYLQGTSPKDIITKYNYYTSTKKHDAREWYNFQFKSEAKNSGLPVPKTKKKTYTEHGAAPGLLLREALPRFFSVTESIFGVPQSQTITFENKNYNCQISKFGFDSQSIGTTRKGKLKNPAAIKKEAPYYKSETYNRNRNYATTEMINLLEKAGCIMFEKTKAKIQVHDLSMINGGGNWDKKPKHKSHQAGRSADVGYFIKTDEKHDNVIQNLKTDSRFDVKANWEFIKTLVEQGNIYRIYTDDAYINEFKKLAPKNEWNKYKGKIKHLEEHHHHFHIRIRCPKNDENCREHSAKNIAFWQKEDIGDIEQITEPTQMIA